RARRIQRHDGRPGRGGRPERIRARHGARRAYGNDRKQRRERAASGARRRGRPGRQSQDGGPVGAGWYGEPAAQAAVPVGRRDEGVRQDRRPRRVGRARERDPPRRHGVRARAGGVARNARGARRAARAVSRPLCPGADAGDELARSRGRVDELAAGVDRVLRAARRRPERLSAVRAEAGAREDRRGHGARAAHAARRHGEGRRGGEAAPLAAHERDRGFRPRKLPLVPGRAGSLRAPVRHDAAVAPSGPMADFTSFHIQTSDPEVSIVGRRGGEGPPLLLLHGNPLTNLSWQRIAPRLARSFTVVATDLRGYGDSSKPRGKPDHSNSSFRRMAQDQVDVMRELGFEKFFVAGHDRGARTTFRMALDHPERVLKAAFLDILPTHHVWTEVSMAWAINSYHWMFMAQPYDFPERLLRGNEEYYIRKSLPSRGSAKGASPRRRSASTSASAPPSRSMACARTTAPPPPSTSRWTPPISTRAGRCNARCSCYGASSATPASTTSHAPFGRGTARTSCACSRYRAGTIRASRRRSRLTRSCSASSLAPDWSRVISAALKTP